MSRSDIGSHHSMFFAYSVQLFEESSSFAAQSVHQPDLFVENLHAVKLSNAKLQIMSDKSCAWLRKSNIPWSFEKNEVGFMKEQRMFYEKIEAGKLANDQ